MRCNGRISTGETRYEILPLNEIRDCTSIRDLDQLARASGLLEILLKKNRGATYALADLSPAPKVISLGDARIVEYRYSWATGPRVLVLNGKISALTGQCSFPALRAFRLDGKIYIESGSSCCECGISGIELFRITPEGTVLVHSDYSLSTYGLNSTEARGLRPLERIGPPTHRFLMVVSAVSSQR
jgi:hypothetical protein